MADKSCTESSIALALVEGSSTFGFAGEGNNFKGDLLLCRIIFRIKI
jgi:hypothetical protein